MSLPVLHIWPGQWGLWSNDPPCLAAGLYLQLAMPGKFLISYCTNPDLSPSGVLPFLTHGREVVSPLSPIIKYISGLKGDTIDAGLNSFEISQKIAWCSHIEANLGDLVSYMLYSLPANWVNLTHRTLAYSLPVPQRYYVPGRIRGTHRPRLEAAGLWHQHVLEPSDLLPSKSSADHKEKIAQAFQREKACQTARDSFELYARLLQSDNQFVYRGRLTSLDVALAAHILVILKPPFPDPLFSDLLVKSYPTLVAHAERILQKSLDLPAPVHSSPNSHSISSLFPSFGNINRTPARSDKSDEDREFELVSWGWTALAVGSVGLYFLAIGSPLAWK
ncbi:hypothetical protein B0H15DRAFT_822415 [Mycena belliarum]|uniref:Mitochondrial outer membrane transport complex Sam37/metaxin N-terminal domain-containing protein n=1 Tax=Mycena belliarum TaxID=1033014 RepID=A0AAD6XR69_9AGAR|nr:hypothetical protein B0H15DRAFT_822415 [Mycena belliae]